MRLREAVTVAVLAVVAGVFSVNAASASASTDWAACVYVNYTYSHALSASGPYVYEGPAGEERLEPRYRGDTIRVPVCS
ncbi:hypothetical protein AB5J62_12610 [Amycolatopsis sp. cg5]|uniref:hypothetical protein n=1 Tax=Amycolatopsis sp. cg5 TaxID=3238802 RepID=UPI0035245845